MINVVEQSADVVLQHPVPCPAALARDGKGIVCRSPGAVPIGVVMKNRLQYWFQHQDHNGLRNSIADRRYAKYPLSSRFLRNRHGFDRRGKVAPR